MTGNFHVYLVYIFGGYLISLPLIFLGFKLFKINNPYLRQNIFLFALTMPLGIYFFSWALLGFTTSFYCQSFFNSFTPPFYASLCSIALKLSPFLMIFIFLTTTIALLKGLAGYILSRRMYSLSKSIYLPLSIKDILTEQSRKVGVAIPPIALIEDSQKGVYTCGFTKPIIVMDSSLVCKLSIAEVRAVLTHELIHVKRRDNLRNWLVMILRDLMSFVPFSYLFFKSYLAEGEFICDEEGIEVTKEPLAYGKALIKVWRFQKERTISKISPLVSGFLEPQGLEGRVNNILNVDEKKVSKFAPAFVYLFFFMTATITALFTVALC